MHRSESDKRGLGKVPNALGTELTNPLIFSTLNKTGKERTMAKIIYDANIPAGWEFSHYGKPKMGKPFS